MKEKKEKKSLVDIESLETLDNSLKRSTRLKQLVRLLPSSNFGTSSTSIQTTSSSDLPPIYLKTTDTILICNTVGRYNEFIKRSSEGLFPYSKYDNDNLIYIGGGRENDDVDDVGGWYYYNNPKGGYTDFSKTIFGNVEGYLFLFFGTKRRYRGVCTQCYKEAEVINECETFDTNQGKMFAVFISNISQINALNKTLALNSDGIFLSTNINNTDKISNVIKNLKDYDDNNTSIIPYDPVNPLSLFPEVNVVKFSGMQYTTLNIKDRFLPQQTFISSIPLNNIQKFLPLSHVQKLSFSVQNLSTFDFDDNDKSLSGVAELVDKTSIKFLTSGFCIISYTIGYCEDAENIYENPKGPSFYGPKVFSVRIKATIYPA